MEPMVLTEVHVLRPKIWRLRGKRFIWRGFPNVLSTVLTSAKSSSTTVTGTVIDLR